MVLQRPARILPLIIIAQFLGTSTWFAGNAILPLLQQQWQLPDSAVAPLTNSVQFGFICGALLFAILALADRISPRLLFFLCATGSALANLLIAVWAADLSQVLVLRFIGGMMLAGVYPVGMKIATGWYPEGLGRALGYLVGALALGTASPHLVSAWHFSSWQPVIYLVSGGAFLGGWLILLGVPDGPALHRGKGLKLRDLWLALQHKPLRASAGGYFGHMWELYAVWALVPFWLRSWAEATGTSLNVSFWSFTVIAAGMLGCIMGGRWSGRFGSRRVAFYMLLGSGLCCLLSPLMFTTPFWLMILFWWFWGFTIVGDSPQFSALSAQTSPPAVVGSALTMINCVGFSITIVAVQLSAGLLAHLPVAWLMWLFIPGPVLGMLSLRWLARLEKA